MKDSQGNEGFPGKGDICASALRGRYRQETAKSFSVAGTRGRQRGRGDYDTRCNLDFILMGMGSMEVF